MKSPRNDRPTAYTQADRARIAAALARHDKDLARRAMRSRIARLSCFAAAIIVAIGLFYSLTN